MTKDVLITVRGVQRDGDGNETAEETVCKGEFYDKGGARYLLYEERDGDGDGAVKHIIKVKGKVLELTKKGVVNARMVFEQGQTHMTDYATPYGLVRFGVRAHRVSCIPGEDEMEILAEYALTAEDETLSECEISIRAKAVR